jgi:tRNA threonylcarbamoyladenosine biosynthesis protein TsaE
MRQSDPTIFIAENVEQMRALGGALAAALNGVSESAVVVAIRGDLGAGKTTFVGGLLNALGHRGPARSPTYTLIEPYELSARPIYHLDLYRLVDPSEVEGLGVRDLLAGNSVLLIEWPEKGGDFVPATDLGLLLEYRGAGRQLQVSTHSPVGQSLMARFAVATKP